METFEYHPSVGWVGADVWFGRVAGYDRLELAGSTSWLDHTDAVGTITMQTDPTGADTWDATHYPWGQPWQQTGSHPTGGFYADLEFAINDPAIPSATREYNPYYYRWQTPDPGGRKVVKLDNPQTWNMYAYVGDNPTTLNDPSGMAPPGSSGACHKESSQVCTQAGADGQTKSRSREMAVRVVMAGEAAVNGVVAGAKVVASSGLASLSVETGGASLVPAYVIASSASGNVTAAGIQLTGAITGKTSAAAAAAKVATSAASPTGLITLATTRGNLRKAERNAAYEGVLTTNPTELANGSLVSVTAKVIDYLQTLYDASSN